MPDRQQEHNNSTRSEGKEEDDHNKDKVKGRFLMDSYILGNKMNVPNFQDQVMNAFSEYVLANAILPSGDLVNRIYSNTPKTSPLRRFIVDVTPHLDSSFSKSDDDPKEYLGDLLEAYSNFHSHKPRKSKALLDRTMRTYHTDVHTLPVTRSKKRKSRWLPDLQFGSHTPSIFMGCSIFDYLLVFTVSGYMYVKQYTHPLRSR